MENRLFVRNLASSVELGQLAALFDSVGEVDTAEYGPPDERNGLKTAYIKMRTAEAASDGIERFNGHRCDGLSLIVTSDKPHCANPARRTKKKGRR